MDKTAAIVQGKLTKENKKFYLEYGWALAILNHDKRAPILEFLVIIGF
jgi:hypothetical protein